jgi:hypothetical protein
LQQGGGERDRNAKRRLITLSAGEKRGQEAAEEEKEEGQHDQQRIEWKRIRQLDHAGGPVAGRTAAQVPAEQEEGEQDDDGKTDVVPDSVPREREVDGERGADVWGRSKDPHKEV